MRGTAGRKESLEIEAQVLTLPDGEPLIVRTATAEDAPATLALLRSVVDEGLFTVRESSEFDVTEDEEREYIEEDRGKPGGAGQPVPRRDGGGQRRGRDGPGPRGDLQAYGALRGHRRLLVGGRFLEAAGGSRGLALGSCLLGPWARDCVDIEKLGLFAFSTNEAAIRLYRRHGFAVEGRYPRDLKLGDGTYADTVPRGLMVKERPAASRA